MKRKVDYEKAWKKVRKWASKDPHGSVWTTDILDKIDEIRKQCTKPQKKQEGK